jgi:hypothetical protein
MRYIDTTLGHHFYRVTVAGLISDVSSDTENND